MQLLIKIITKMSLALLNEQAIKKIAVIVLEKVVKLTETDLDDKILQIAKNSWNIK